MTEPIRPLRSLAILWGVLTPAQRRRFAVLQLVSVIMALSTVLGLAAIMIFFAVLADPKIVESHAVLETLWRWRDGTSQEFLVTLATAFIGLFIVNALVNVLGARAMSRFAYAVSDRIRERLFAEYLRRDYLFHVRTRPARLADNVLYQSDRVTVALHNGQLLITNGALGAFVVISIALVNFAVALAGTIAIAAAYLIAYRVIRRRVVRNGEMLSHVGAERVAIVEQSFFGIKYLRIAHAEAASARCFGAVTRAMSRTAADTQFIAQYPKYLLECAAGVALIGCATLAVGGAANATWLAQLSFIGFAGFRLLPAIQQMYYAFVLVRANLPAIEHLAQELRAASPSGAVELPMVASAAKLTTGVVLSGVSFRYSPNSPLVLDDVTLDVRAGTAIGIVGASGSGKTTLVDVMLGLLAPVDGCIEIDGRRLDEHSVAGWQRSIGYVPQEVMIVDASVRENIAFGVDPDKIDDARVQTVLRQAGANKFIETLPGGIAAKISGLGGGLSGGQRQRIGIARALYSDPALLVLDEATNSLDADAERTVIDLLVRNRGSRTLIIVAHGAEPIAACDRVYELRRGTLFERSLKETSGRATFATARRG